MAGMGGVRILWNVFIDVFVSESMNWVLLLHCVLVHYPIGHAHLNANKIRERFQIAGDKRYSNSLSAN